MRHRLLTPKELGIILGLACISISIMGLFFPAKSEERIGLAPNALICDTLEQAIQTIYLGNNAADGCGFTDERLWVEVVPQTVFTAREMRFKLVQYDFPVRYPDGRLEVWTQSGFWGTPQPAIPEAGERI